MDTVQKHIYSNNCCWRFGDRIKCQFYAASLNSLNDRNEVKRRVLCKKIMADEWVLCSEELLFAGI
jgi:hypothetical protein